MNAKKSPDAPTGTRSAGFRWNRSAMIVGLMALLGFAAFIFLLHRVQAAKIASALLSDARVAKQRSEWELALQTMFRYLQHRPEDTAAYVELANWYSECPSNLVEPQIVLTVQREAMVRLQTAPELKSALSPLQSSYLRNCIEHQQYADALGWILGPASSQDVADSLQPELAVCRYRSWTQDGMDRVKEAHGSAPWLVTIQSLSIVDHLALAWQQSPGAPRIADSLVDAALHHPGQIADSQFASLTHEELVHRARTWLEESVRAYPEAPAAWQAFVQHAPLLGIDDLDQKLDGLLTKFPNDTSILVGVGRFASQSQSASQGESGGSLDLQRQALARRSLQRMRELSESSKEIVFPGTFFAIMGDLAWQVADKSEAIEHWKHGLQRGASPRAFLVLRCIRALIELRHFQDAATMLSDIEEAILRDAPYLPEDDFLRLSLDAKRVRIQYNSATNQFQAMSDVLGELAANAKIPSVARSEFLASAGIAELKNERWEQAGMWLDQASSLSPSDDSLHRLAASAWIQTNRIDRALKHTNLVASKTQSDWLQIASLVLSLQSTANATELGWEAFDQALSSAALESPLAVRTSDQPLPATDASNWQLEAMRWEAHAERAHGDSRIAAIQEAVDGLEQLCRANPAQERLWVHTARLLQRWGQPASATALLETHTATHPTSSLARRLNAERSLKRGDVAEAIAACQSQLTVTPEDIAWLELWWRCEEIALDSQESWDRIVAWCSEQPTRWRRFAAHTIGRLQSSHRRDAVAAANVSLASTRIDVLSRLEQRLRDFEGETGSDWKWVRGRALLLRADLDPEAPLDEVASIARTLASDRPNWSETHTLTGLLSNRIGEYRTALKSFERAIEGGDQRWEAYERLIDGLYREGMFSQAADWIRRMKEQSNFSYRIASIALQLEMNSNQSWLERARQGVQFRPEDPLAWVWHAQALQSEQGNPTDSVEADSESDGFREQVDAAWQRAMELERDDRWAAHFAALAYYASRQQRDRLEMMRDRLSGLTDRMSASGWLLRGLIEQELGNWNNAEHCFEKSLQAGGDALGVGLQMSRLKMLQGDVPSSIQRFEELLKTYSNDEDLRSAAAVALAVRGSAKDWERIMSLLQSSHRESSPSDRRTLARLLLQRGGPRDLQRAQSLLDGLLLSPATATDEDRFQLAILHLRMHANKLRTEMLTSPSGSETDHLRLAQEHLRALADRPNAPANHLVTYANLLLDQEKWDLARQPIQRLQAIAPSSADAILMRARLAKHTDGLPTATGLITQWLNMPSSESPLPNTTVPNHPVSASDEVDGLRRLTQAANAYWTIHAWPEAESTTRRLLDSNREFGKRLLAMQAEATRPEIRQRAFAMLLESSALNLGRPDAFQLLRLVNTQSYAAPLHAQAESLLEQYGESQPDDLEFLLYFSDRKIAQGDTARAIAILRHVLARDPRNPLAANNLATLLSESPGKLNEAIQTIASAIELVGPHPVLLDTHGTILVQANRVEEALPLLERAARQGADPRFAFHWMLGLAKSNHMDAARKVWKSIDLDALKGMRLSDQDRDSLQQWLSANP